VESDGRSTARGLTIFFTGLSGAGKTTLAEALCVRLPQIDPRVVRLLDGDRVREHLSPGLGFSKPDRDLHVQRVGFIASEITACGGIAICAAIAPYDDARRGVRALVEGVGAFVLIYVATPLDICERRDVKGLYARARAGQIQAFTGVSDPYEAPADAEIVLDAARRSVSATVDDLLGQLASRGLIGM